MPDSMTPLLISGPPGTKYKLAVLGDGFTDDEQAIYNAKVQELLMDGVFENDCFYEDKQAFNIYRINLISSESGVSHVKYDTSDKTVTSDRTRNTALGYIYNGSWEHFWIEEGADTDRLVHDALDALIPDYNFVLVILNEDGWGACSPHDGYQIVTLGGDWPVMAHEFGHGIGGLDDEYCVHDTYSVSEPAYVNTTINTNRATLKWSNFVAPTTPIPTGIADATAPDCTDFTEGPKDVSWIDHQDVGLFEGGGTCKSGIYRPVINCRMRHNQLPFCPVCYTHMKETCHKQTGCTFLNCCVGDFNGDGKDDLLIHNGNSIAIYESNGSQLDLVFNAVNEVPGSWEFKPNDKFYIGDFNGDGKDEVLIYNSVDWTMPRLGLVARDGNNGLTLIARYDGSIPGKLSQLDWQLRKTDQFYVADFNGDRKEDLYVFNSKDGLFSSLGMLLSSGSGFKLIQRYDPIVPGNRWPRQPNDRWLMKPNDTLAVGDFDGDGKVDLLIFNGTDWSIPHLGLFRSNGSSLNMLKRFVGLLPNWSMGRNDQHFIGDFDGDGKADLFVFNGTNWNNTHLGMFESARSDFVSVARYDDIVPGWQMGRNDLHYVADINGDGKDDLIVYNYNNWPHRYLGMMVSNGTTLNAYKEKDSLGEWTLSADDRFVPCNYEGTAGKRNLFVQKRDKFGMMRASSNSISLQKMYYRWIHNYHYGRNQ